jgi:hypothetical protein
LKLGFQFEETMSGSYHRIDTPGEEHPISFTVKADVRSLRKFLLEPIATIQGRIDARGLATDKPLQGTLEINPILKRKLIYDFRFENDAGAECRFFGEKDLEALRLVQTMTTLPGSVFEGDNEVARAVLRFPLRKDMVRFLRSWRPR